MTQPILQFLGRLHPLLVHFPIALITFALMMEFLSFWRGKGQSATAYACASFGALCALAAAGTGWLNAATETQARSLSEVLTDHRWAGVALACLSVLCWVFMTVNRIAPGRFTLHVYRGLLLSAALLVPPLGHLGGTLVYGEGYLTEMFEPPPEVAVKEPQGEVDDATRLHTEKIQPIFEANCIKCHGPKKKKGNLRLDELPRVFEGDPSDWVIVPGDAKGSLLVQRISLEEWDPDHMPQDEESLPAEEIDLIRRWIDAGARYPGDGR
ncbi:MAG: c-type cytochrome domain-containing protein [Planctomycetota bacterium]